MLEKIKSNAQLWAVRIIFGIIILVFIFWGVGNFAVSPQHTAAEVNGEGISMTEVLKEAESNIEGFRRSVPDFATNTAAQQRFKELVLRELVQSTLRRQEAERLGLFVSHMEVSAVIAGVSAFQNEQGKFDNERYKTFLKGRGWTQAEFQENYRRSLLDEKLIALATSGVGVTEAEAKSAFDFGLAQHTARYVLFSGAAYMDKATVTDQEIAAWYETNKDTLRLPARIDLDYIELTPKALAGNVTVTDDEIAKYFADHTADYTDPAGYRSRQIFLRLPKSDAPEYAAALSKANALMGEIQKKLADGVDFGELAKQYSEEPTTKGQGGDMGFLPKGILPEAVDTAAFALNPGQVSAPVQTMYGLHLIKLEDKQDARPKSLDDVRADVREKLVVDKAQEVATRLQEKAEEALRLGTAFDKMAVELNAPLKHTGLMPRDEAIALLQLQKDAVAALAGVPAGRAAPSPLSVTDGVALVFIKEIKPEEIPALDAVKADIAARLKKGRADDMAREAAQKALAEFVGPDVPAAYKDKAVESKPFSVAAPVLSGLTGSEGLAEALLAAPADKWLPQTYSVAEGTVIARPLAVTPVKAEDWEALKGMFMSNLLQRKREDVAMAFMNNLLDKATISINADALGQISLK